VIRGARQRHAPEGTLSVVDDDWQDAVSLRLTSLALDGSGRLSDDVVLGVAVRGALLVDLVLRHPAAMSGNGVGEVGSTGFPPADRLLSTPGQSAVSFLRRGLVDQADLAAEHVRRGSWSDSGSRLRPRYRDQLVERTKRDALLMAPSSAQHRTPADAALAAIAGALGVLRTGRTRPTDELLVETRTARPLIKLVVQHIDDNIEAFTDGP
jgi:hypothetical protein